MEFIQQNLMWVTLAAASGGMLLWQTLKSSGVKNVSVGEATLMINRQDALVVDVRETAEWSAGHIPAARHFPLSQFAKHLVEIEKLKDKPVILVCASGNRSGNAAKTLMKAGFLQVFNLAGGMRAWIDAGLPVTKK
ncbi:rhodanese-like domain-containing protein [Sulfuricystis multivorans]|uniref:rhodanese-like domain-containing protein n=1 Tax=Sulfuricystis multivorans TaxID=2211108 RepID=UPI000F828F0B|nr:rhodanese-like domain-containing protein [Sulfuricystis multivorans]